MTRIAVLAATLLTAGIAANALSLTANAAPDLKNPNLNGTVKGSSASATIFQIPKHVEDPGAGRYTALLEASMAESTVAKTGAPVHIAEQNVGEFTNVFQPSFLTADGKVRKASKPRLTQAKGTDNPLTIDSKSYSSKLHYKELAKIDANIKAARTKSAARSTMHVKLADTPPCNALDAKLDKSEMSSGQQLATLDKHECLLRTTT